MTEDAELLRAYAHDRAENVFAELVSRHLNLVYSAALQPQRWQIGQFVTAQNWSDAGNQSADSSLETFLWAGRSGNFDRMLQLLTWQIDGTEATDPELENEMTRAMTDMMEFAQKVKGVSLVRFKPITKETVWIDIMARNESGSETQMGALFRLTERGWQLSEHAGKLPASTAAEFGMRAGVFVNRPFALGRFPSSQSSSLSERPGSP